MRLLAQLGIRKRAAAASLLLLAALATGCTRSERYPAFVSVPERTVLLGSRESDAAFPPSIVSLPSFSIGKYELTVEEYVRFLNEQPSATCNCPHIVRTRDGYKARRGTARLPITGVSRADAERYCKWLSGKLSRRIRLPSEAEWERAARAGLVGGRYPWGWGSPKGRACFATDGPQRVGRYKPNALGLHDMAGNVAEWCLEITPDGQAIARGGSWAERDPRMLYVFRRLTLPLDYCNHDVGFRVLMED